MSKFFTKTSAFVFVCSSLLFGATDNAAVSVAITSEEDGKPPVAGAVLNLGEVITDIRHAEPAVLPFQKCVLNFSDPKQTARGIASFLLTEKITGTLDLIDIAYLTFEGIAAASRKTPAAFGKLAQYFADEDAVYQNIGHVMGSLNVAGQTLVILENLTTCKNFVNETITTDLPKLLTRLGASVEDQADIVLLARVFASDFSIVLNGAILSTKALQKTVADFGKTVEGRVSACSCFPWLCD
ncbi:MAG: hypothetical protein NTW22_02865 [Proteobacteria bacterium]|nr:hypothetical protein [Pseudomonadota bacterium]